MKGEGMVDQGVMLVCARYFATCHRVVKCHISFYHTRVYKAFQATGPKNKLGPIHVKPGAFGQLCKKSFNGTDVTETEFSLVVFMLDGYRFVIDTGTYSTVCQNVKKLSESLCLLI